MTLAEIRSILRDNSIERSGETIDEYSQRIWNNAPRIPYKELPLSLQRDVRARFTPANLQAFLRECYTKLSFESMTADIEQETFEKLLIRTRNAAVYTIEAEGAQQRADGTEEILIAPMMYGDFAVSAFETVMEEYRAKKQQEEEKKRKKEESPESTEAERAAERAAKKAAQEAKAQAAKSYVSAGYYQAIISDKDYKHAMTTQRNNTAYIAMMTPEFFQQITFENGTMTYKDEFVGTIKAYRKGTYTDIRELDMPLLWNFYTAAWRAHIRHDTYTITVSMTQFFREAGIEISKGNSQDVMQKLHTFENCVGILPGLKTVSKLFTIIQIDWQNQTITIAIPYILKLFEILDSKNKFERKTKQGALYDFERPYHNMLVYSSIASERNKTAVEIVYIITNGLLQRGFTPDIRTYRRKDAKTEYPDRITYSPSFRTIIHDAPILRGRINSYATVQDKNKAIRRAFEKAYELIDKKTDASKYFCKLNINRVIPTMQTLDDKLYITHEGRNGDYRPHS